MKTKLFVFMAVLAAIVSCSSGGGGGGGGSDAPKFCVYSETQECYSTDMSSCPAGGKLGDSCPFAGKCGDLEYNTGKHLCDTRSNTLYKLVKINGKTWMAENLNHKVDGSKCYGEGGTVYIAHDENGMPVGVDKTLSAAEASANCAKYGRLYELAAAENACPKGWHLPSYADWDNLYSYAEEGSCSYNDGFGACKTAGKHLRAKSGWSTHRPGYGPVLSGNGKDTYGFSAMPGGSRSLSGVFVNAGFYAYWWSSDGDQRYTSVNPVNTGWGGANSQVMYSVRCVEGQAFP